MDWTIPPYYGLSGPPGRAQAEATGSMTRHQVLPLLTFHSPSAFKGDRPKIPTDWISDATFSPGTGKT